ncbi:MAG: OmpA family protein [Akkermansiaceae bacterium]|nr:OmpA family protein [Akkermansiaceae bacterium]
MPETPEKNAESTIAGKEAEIVKQDAVANDAPQAHEADAAPKQAIPPFVVVGLLVAAVLVVVLVVMNGQKKKADSEEDRSAMKAEVEAMRGELNRQRMSMGLRPLENGGESIDDITKRLTKDAESIVGLAHSFQGMLKEKDAALDAKNGELITSEKLRQSFAAENNRLQTELSRLLVSGADGDLAKKEVAEIKGQRDRLAAELAKVQRDLASAAGGRSQDEYADLQRQHAEAKRSSDFFEKRVKELEAELAKLRIFAKSESELLPAAVELFRTLRGLEGTKDADNMTAYSDIGVKLGARVLRTLDFPTGSSELTPEDIQAIPGLVEQVEEGDLIFVVGYASTTGNPESNRVLSSDRATAAAQAVSTVKRPDQMVQAVYIGQTTRFGGSSPERNQICEIWHIKKK